MNEEMIRIVKDIRLVKDLIRMAGWGRHEYLHQQLELLKQEFNEASNARANKYACLEYVTKESK